MSRKMRFGWIAVGLLAFVACGSDPPTTPTAPTLSRAGVPQPSPPQPSPPNAGTDPILGRYTLALKVGSACSAVPDAARNRTYAATIASTGEATYVVTLSDATFLTGLICTLGSGPLAGVGCHQFLASREGDVFRFNLVNNNDEAHGGHIVEQVPPGGWVEVIGNGTGQLEGTTITATGAASL